MSNGRALFNWILTAIIGSFLLPFALNFSREFPLALNVSDYLKSVLIASLISLLYSSPAMITLLLINHQFNVHQVSRKKKIAWLSLVHAVLGVATFLVMLFMSNKGYDGKFLLQGIFCYLLIGLLLWYIALRRSA